MSGFIPGGVEAERKNPNLCEVRFWLEAQAQARAKKARTSAPQNFVSGDLYRGLCRVRRPPP